MNRIMQILSIVTMVVGFLTGPMSSAQAQTTCLTSPLVPSQDAKITGGAQAAQNFGATPTLVVGNFGGNPNRTLVQFDVSAVPSMATVTTATLSLSRTVGPAGTILIHAANSVWSEATVTWSSFAGAIGASAGSLSLPAGNPATVSASIIAMVQSWVSGTSPNRGLVLSPGPTAAGFSSKEGAIKPTLNVCFTLPSCSDGIQNQGEIGVDCGGPCAACPTCSDGIKNGVETDIDCGGGTCVACDEGGACGVDADCLTGSCSAGTCAWPTCDSSGDCGDVSSGCTACALAGQCADAYDACASSQTCIDYTVCLGGCQDQTCVDACYVADPVSGAIYDALLACVYCNACPMDCPESSQDLCG